MRIIIVAAALALLAAQPIEVERWRGRADDRPVEDLLLMNETELMTEAFRVCYGFSLHWGSSLYPNIEAEATHYLDIVRRVARKQQPGREPEWVGEFRSLLTRDPEASKCQMVFEKRLRQNKPREKKGR